MDPDLEQKLGELNLLRAKFTILDRESLKAHKAFLDQGRDSDFELSVMLTTQALSVREAIGLLEKYIEKAQEKLEESDDDEYDDEDDDDVPYSEYSWLSFNRYTFYTYLVGLGIIGFIIGCVSIEG